MDFFIFATGEIIKTQKLDRSAIYVRFSLKERKESMKHAGEDYNRIQDPENKIPADEPVFLLRA